MTCRTDSMTLAVVLLAVFISGALGSAGDGSWFFQKCMRNCRDDNCTDLTEDDYSLRQPWHMRFLRWTCEDECDYECMWNTVDAFQRDHSKIPQFHGKWPFIRVFGIQEPASTICSLLNLLAHVYGLYRFRKFVSREAPMYWVIHFNCAISVNSWSWSAVFHSRDWPITEKMDYFCAISLVLTSVFVLCARILGTGKESMPKLAACAAVLLSLFTYHVHYLAFVRFDYGYNMKANVAVGFINSLGWLSWSLYVFKRQRYVWKCIVCIISINVLLLLEVGDFPPVWWVFDAHSLWHLGTSPVAVFWYSFVTDDCKFTERHPHMVKLSDVFARKGLATISEMGEMPGSANDTSSTNGKKKTS